MSLAPEADLIPFRSPSDSSVFTLIASGAWGPKGFCGCPARDAYDALKIDRPKPEKHPRPLRGLRMTLKLTGRRKGPRRSPSSQDTECQLKIPAMAVVCDGSRRHGRSAAKSHPPRIRSYRLGRTCQSSLRISTWRESRCAPQAMVLSAHSLSELAGTCSGSGQTQSVWSVSGGATAIISVSLY